MRNMTEERLSAIRDDLERQINYNERKKPNRYQSYQPLNSYLHKQAIFVFNLKQ